MISEGTAVKGSDSASGKGTSVVAGKGSDSSTSGKGRVRKGSAKSKGASGMDSSNTAGKHSGSASAKVGGKGSSGSNNDVATMSLPTSTRTTPSSKSALLSRAWSKLVNTILGRQPTTKRDALPELL